MPGTLPEASLPSAAADELYGMVQGSKANAFAFEARDNTTLCVVHDAE